MSKSKTSVSILGGGVGGMSAAHELSERGFDVSVYETRSLPGGKARSVPFLGSGTGGRPDLPAEHGFRFFPGFYKHLPDVMKRIPYRKGTVFDNLVPVDQLQLARSDGKAEIFAPAHFPTSFADLVDAFKFLTAFYCDFGIPKDEVRFFLQRLLVLMTSCEARRFDQYENISWWDFIEANSKSEAYQLYLAKGLSRSLVAMNANELSARTGGYILLQFLFDFSTPGAHIDRVLNGPTNDVWIDPWLSYLEGQGVKYHPDSEVESFECDGDEITGVYVRVKGKDQLIKADYYISALPVEVMREKVTPEMLAADPALNGLHQLKTSWMTGIIFYLSQDVPIVRGHSNYLNADWALTSISQAQFWPDFDLANYGDSTTKGILSVIISNWDETAAGLNKTAKECTEDEVIEEVWNQLKAHLNDGSVPVLEDRFRQGVCLAPCISYTPGSLQQWSNDEPLLINTVGSWQYRPNSSTKITNLMLASDYIRTFTDLATMESANEAARRAVNDILIKTSSAQPPCGIWPLEEPWILFPYQVADSVRHTFHLPAFEYPVPPLPWPCPPS